jgi:hypothetical protein
MIVTALERWKAEEALRESKEQLKLATSTQNRQMAGQLSK